MNKASNLMTVEEDQGVFMKHYAPAATKSKKLFLASMSKSMSQGF